MIAVNATKLRTGQRDALMCQNCGAVSVASYDRQKSHNKNGFSYCDKECSYADRGRVYRTSEAYQLKYAESCRQRGLVPRVDQWARQVCKIYAKKCAVCHNSFMGQQKRKYCSGKCQKEQNRQVAWIIHRTTQTPRETACRECGVVFTALTRTREPHHYCGRVCAARYARRNAEHIRRERIRGSQAVSRGRVSLRQQYEKFKGKCQICKCNTVMAKEYRVDMATVDHIVPLSKGGLHVEENVQLACIACNSQKSDTLTSERQMLLW